MLDPFEIRPLICILTSSESVTTSASSTNEREVVIDKNSELLLTQESALESIGVNPANLPNSITLEMEACFTTKLVYARVAEIKRCDSSTLVEVFTTRFCYK